MCHRAPENALPHTGHAKLKSGNRRSGAHTNTLGCNARVHISSHVRAPLPSLRLRAFTPSALWVSAAGRTQGSPASSARPSSMLSVTSRTACLTHAAPESAPVVVFENPSATRKDGASLEADRLSCLSECCALLGFADCGRATQSSMSRTDSWCGSRRPADAPTAAAPALLCVPLIVSRDALRSGIAADSWAFLVAWW